MQFKYALVVDDEEFNRQIVRLCLEPLGYKIIEAGDGLEAIEYFQQQKFDLVTMDYHMPIKNGVAAIKAIREFNKTTPIIGITSAAQAMRRALEHETQVGVLEKPLEPDQLKAMIAAL